MKTATGLTLIAIGAVLAFAVNGHPWFLNLQICGWILMIIGAIGLFIPRRGYGWLRRQMVVRRTPDGQRQVGVREKRYPPYIMINPAAAGVAGSTPEDATTDMPVMPTDSDEESWSEADATVVPEHVVREHVVRERVVPERVVPERVVPDKETVEEFFQE
jgi:hypothetical protein